MVKSIINKNIFVLFAISIISFLFILLLGYSLIATNNTRFGRVINNPVQEFHCKTEMQSVVTEKNQICVYVPEEPILFYIGGVKLGGNKVKPSNDSVHIASNIVGVSHSTVANHLQIQSLGKPHGEAMGYQFHSDEDKI